VSVESILFFLFAVSAVGSAVLMILQRNPIMGAIYLIANFFCISAMYLLLRAQFVAIIQILVYAGAIMVLVVFVIMLLNLGNDERLADPFSMKKVVATVLVFGFLLEMLYIFGSNGASVAYQEIHPNAARLGTAESIGDAMFGKFLLPFEVTSLLLLAAIVGAVVLAKKRL